MKNSNPVKKVVMLGAGLGTRLHPVTYEIPKPLLPVQGKPIMNHQIELFRRHNVSEFGIVVLKRHADHFKRWLKAWKDELPYKSINIFYQEEPMGTFGALYPAREWIGDKSFLVSNGDDLKELDVKKLILKHEEYKPVATLALAPVPDPEHYGVPVMEGALIRGFLEKPKNSPSRFVSAGLYVVSKEIFNDAEPKETFVMFETDIFPALAKEGKLVGVEFEDARIFDCGTLERWEKAIKEW